MKKVLVVMGILLFLQKGISYSQTLQVTLSPDKSKVDRNAEEGKATIIFDSDIEDLSIICTDENPNEPIVKVTDNMRFIRIDVKKDLDSDGICYRNFLLKCSSSAEYYLTTDPISPKQVLYYTITLPNELEPKFLEEKAKNIAKKAEELVDEGDSYLARLLLLHVSSSNMPYTPEVEFALRKACQYNNAILKGHTNTVHSAVFSPDGKRIVSASYDMTVRIWDAETGRQIGLPLEGHTDWVYSATFSPDSKRIVSASGDGTIRIWDAESGHQIGQPMKGHTKRVRSASFSPDGKHIVSASDDNTVRIWDAETGRQIGQPLEGHTELVYFASFSPDGKRIVSASWDRTVRIWDAETGRQIGRPLEGHTNRVRSASFSPDGKRIVSASYDNTIRIWDAETGHQIGQPLEGHTSSVCSASFSPDCKHIISASNDHTVRIWDAETGHQIDQLLEGQKNSVFSASFSPDGKRIVAASGDNTIYICEFPPLQLLIDETRERFKDRPLTQEEIIKYNLE